jgi:Ca2+-binding EF-hand superfamily protein
MAYDDSNMTLEEEYRLRMLQYTPLRGDVNKDGRVDWKDVRRVLRAMDSHPGSCRWDRRCDVNHDGVVNCRDLRIVLRNLGRPAWRNITIEVNTVDNLVYGETTHFSLIGIHKPA